jgi:hypothetical protein
MQRSRRVSEGVLAGAFSGLLIAVMLFVNYGPGNELGFVARWLGLGSFPQAKLLGFVLVVASGALFGLLFGLFMSRSRFNLLRAVLAGLLTGLLWWLVLPVLFGILIRRESLALYTLLLFLVLGLVYGIVLSHVYWKRTRTTTISESKNI